MALQVISQSKEPEIDRSLIKLIFLGLVGVSLSFLTVYFWNRFLITGLFENILWTVLSAIFLFVINILNVFFVKSLKKLNLILFLEAFSPLALFYNNLYPNPSISLILGALAYFLFLFFGTAHGIKSISNSLKIHFWGTARATLPKVVTGFLIFLSVVLYLNYFEWDKFNENLGKKFLYGSLRSSEPIFKIFLTEVSFDEKLSVFLNKISEAQLKKIKSEELERVLNFKGDFNNLPTDLKAVLIRNVSNQLEASLEKIVGPVDSSKPVKNLIYELMKKYFSSLNKDLSFILALSVALSVFFTMKGITVIFYWFIIFTAFVIFKLSMILNFSYITLENRSREFILLS